MAAHPKRNDKEVEVHHTKRGVLYAKPKDILNSRNARKQIRALKRSSVYKNIRASRAKK